MTKSLNDLKILEAIYDRYYSDFQSYSEENKTRSSKIYVPISIEELAKKMGVDVDIIFGRLYYHLNKRYRYKQDGGLQVDLFSLSVGDDKHCINFPYLAGILAGLKEKNTKYLVTLWCSIASIAIAVAAVIVSIYR